MARTFGAKGFPERMLEILLSFVGETFHSHGQVAFITSRILPAPPGFQAGPKGQRQARPVAQGFDGCVGTIYADDDLPLRGFGHDLLLACRTVLPQSMLPAGRNEQGPRSRRRHSLPINLPDHDLWP
jgi:hypothetical protein